ncbi:hypothetical protein ACWEQL_34855, partial [Kitasatospora sp. NPDC004240]
MAAFAAVSFAACSPASLATFSAVFFTVFFAAAVAAVLAAVPPPPLPAPRRMLPTSLPPASAGSLPQPLPTMPLTSSTGWSPAVIRPARVVLTVSTYLCGWEMLYGSYGLRLRPSFTMSVPACSTPPSKCSRATGAALRPSEMSAFSC